MLDKDTLFADSLAFGGTPTVLDLGNASPGPGQPLKVVFVTESALTGCTGIVVTDGATVTAADDLMTLDDTIYAAVGTYEFHLPSATQRFVKIALEGSVSAGEFTCGIVMDGQTAK